MTAFRASFGKQSEAHRSGDAAALAEAPRFNRREPGETSADETGWWASTSARLRMRGFAPSHGGTSTTDGCTHNEKHTCAHTPEDLPGHSAISSPRALWYSWRKWSGIAGVSYFSAVNRQVFSSSSPDCVRHLTRDHLEDMDRSSVWWPGQQQELSSYLKEPTCRRRKGLVCRGQLRARIVML